MIEIKHRFTGKVLFCSETATTLKAAAMEADLRGAYLRGADLRGAYLRGAYLRGADLQGADLQGADLQGAKVADDLELLPNGFLTIGPIGSRRDCLQVWSTNKGIHITAGCFRVKPLKEFDAAVKATHKRNQFAKEYAAAIEMIKLWHRVNKPKKVKA